MYINSIKTDELSVDDNKIITKTKENLVILSDIST
jgi:hypothetical protein